jgi:hypothetical protein
MKKVSLAPGVVVEEVGNGVLVMVPGSQDVLSLTGPSADVVRSVQSGVSVAEDSAVAELAGLGVVEVSGVSRRGLIKAGAIGAGAGIAVLAMPGVAAAASAELGTRLVGGEYFFTTSQIPSQPGSPLQWGFAFYLPGFDSNGWVASFDFPVDSDPTDLSVRQLGMADLVFFLANSYDPLVPPAPPGGNSDYVEWFYPLVSSNIDVTDVNLDISVLEQEFSRPNFQGTFTWGELYTATFVYVRL